MKKPISAIYNETELAIFYRQAHFTFGDYHQTADGTVCALDKSSGQLFVGQDLRKNCVHPVESILSVTVDEDGGLCVTFVDSQTICVSLERAASETLAAELKECLPDEDTVSGGGETTGDENPDSGDDGTDRDEDTVPLEEEQIQKEDKVLTETLSILGNSGRSKAIGYLMSKVGLSADEASRYVNELKEQNESVCEECRRVIMPVFEETGKLSQSSILAIVKELKPGDIVHIEYKPLIGKLRVLDAEYCSMYLNLNMRYSSIIASADDFNALKEDIITDLLDFLNINVINPENGSTSSYELRNLRVLTKVSG